MVVIPRRVRSSSVSRNRRPRVAARNLRRDVTTSAASAAASSGRSHGAHKSAQAAMGLEISPPDVVCGEYQVVTARIVVRKVVAPTVLEQSFKLPQADGSEQARTC